MGRKLPLSLNSHCAPKGPSPIHVQSILNSVLGAYPPSPPHSPLFRLVLLLQSLGKYLLSKSSIHVQGKETAAQFIRQDGPRLRRRSPGVKSERKASLGQPARVRGEQTSNQRQAKPLILPDIKFSNISKYLSSFGASRHSKTQ